MERPERPSRHKSNPNRFPIRPTFSSDSESEPNDNDVPIQITFYQAESSNGNPGPSSSQTNKTPNTPLSIFDPPAGPATSADNSNSSLRIASPVAPMRGSMSPLALTPREDEVRSAPSPQDVVRRKRSAASSAASVIFDSVDTLISANSSMSVQVCNNRNSSSPERFLPGEYVIRPKSFCNMVKPNAIQHPTRYKIRRFNAAPIDLTPTTTNRESSTQPLVVTSSFSLQDSVTPLSSSESASSFYSRPSILTNSNPPPGFGSSVIPPRSSQPSASSSILRQFDEMCSTSTSSTVPKRRKYVRFLEESRYSDGHSNDQANNSPSSNRASSLDDYCDLVGNFLFNYPTSSQTTETQRSPPVAVPLERTAVSEPQTSSTADIIDRHAHSIISEINSYLDPPEPSRNTINVELHIDATHRGGDPLEQSSNDDVIVVETPERPPLPGSPDSYIVPSSRSPSPTPALLTRPPATTITIPSAAATVPPSPPPRQDKAQSSGASDVPLTLPELNQSLVALLECPVCLDHATPPIYQCIKGHILCQSCHPRLTSCPMCRSRLPGDRNSVMEKVAEKLMYPCKNTVTGCTMMLKLNDKQAHEEGCGFRHYACIVSTCSWKGYKPELVVHLQSNHPDKLITGATKELHVPINGIIGGSGFVVHHWIQSAHNEVFHVVFNVDTFKRIMKGCVIYVGSREKAEKFEYLFQLKQRVSPFRKLSYSRTTHVDTLKQGQPLCLRDDFSINIDMAQLYRPGECCHQVIPIFITIAQLE